MWHCCPGSWGPVGALSPPPWVTIPSQGSTDPPVVLVFLDGKGRGAQFRCWKRAMPTVTGEPLPKGKPGWGTPWPKQPAACWGKSQLCFVQELAAITTKPVITSAFTVGLCWSNSSANGFSNDHLFVSTFWVKLILCDETSMQSSFLEDVSLFWLKGLSRQNGRVLHTGQGFSSPWLCEDVWDSGNCRERARVRHSPSVWTGSFPGGSCRRCWPGALPGTAGPSWVYGCRLRPSFLYRLAWYFFFSPSPPFPFAPLGSRINQVYTGGSGFFRYLAFPQCAAGKQSCCHKETAGNILSIKSTRYCHWCEQVTDFMLATWEIFTHPMAKREVIRLICGQMKR